MGLTLVNIRSLLGLWKRGDDQRSMRMKLTEPFSVPDWVGDLFHGRDAAATGSGQDSLLKEGRRTLRWWDRSPGLHTKAWMHGHLNASSMHVPRWAGHAKSIGDSTFRGSTGWLGSDASDAGAWRRVAIPFLGL